MPTKVVDQGNELVDVSTPKKHPSTLPPLFKSLVVQKVVIMNELNSRSKGGEENDGNGDESISEPEWNILRKNLKTPMVMRLQNILLRNQRMFYCCNQ